MPTEPKPLVAHILFGGIGGHSRELLTFLASETGKQIRHAAIFLGTDPVAEELLTACNKQGVPYVYVHKPQGFHLGYLSKTYEALKAQKPHTVILHGTLSIPAAWWYAKRYGCRVIVMETHSNHLKTRTERLGSILSQLMADKVVSLTTPYISELKKLTGIFYSPKRNVVLPNGIDTHFFKPLNESPASDAFVIGMQSRLAPSKDYVTLIRAVEKLAQRHPDRHIQLRIGGEGETMPQLQQLVKERQLEALVTFTGYLKSEGVVDFLQHLDLYVQATKGESYCFSVMEALACGLPVVTDDVPVLNVTLANLPFVRFYPSGNVDGLVAEMERHLLDISQRQNAGRQARAYAEEVLSGERMVQQYLALAGISYRA